MIGGPNAHLSELIRLGPPPGWSLAVAERVDSTNRWARRVSSAHAGPAPLPPCLFVAWEQTHGRGRLDRKWSSPPGGGLYASLLLPSVELERVVLLPLLAALGLCNGLARHLKGATVKWPNDVLIGRRKLAGILVEAAGSPSGARAAVVGLGVNYEPRPEPWARDWVAVREAGVEGTSLASLTRDVLEAVVAELESPRAWADTLEAFRSLSAHRVGDPIRFRAGGEAIEGVFRGFDHRGHLRLEEKGVERLLAAGDVVES